MLESLARGLLDLVLPPRCAGCGAQIGLRHSRQTARLLPALLCGDCRDALSVLGRDLCIRCQAVCVEGGTGDQPLCPRCRDHPSPLASCLASVFYTGAGETWIREFKYPEPGIALLRPEPQAVAVAMIFDAASRKPGPLPQLVVPVPLHPRRLRERGFNPAAVLASELARRLGISFASTLLERTRDTLSQTRLSRRDRARNVRGAFARRISSPLPRRIWLVDDVVTTGSTLEEAARSLAARDEIEIHALTAARAPAPDGGTSPTAGGVTAAGRVPAAGRGDGSG